MFVDANELPAGAHTDADVCIVGAGAAGITLALSLARHGITTAVLESGGLTPEIETQRLYDVINANTNFWFQNDTEGNYVFSTLRLRYFGGSTNHWAGTCRPLDPDDFLPRPWVGHSGWPITRANLDPYYPEAMAILDLPPLLHGLSYNDLIGDGIRTPPLLPGSIDFTPIAWFVSPPTRMNEKYRSAIAANERIRCILHANALDIAVDSNGVHVNRIRVGTLAGRPSTVSAKAYVLCAGGIENPRLLLLSDSVIRGGVGNRHDLVGRYLMEHPSTPYPWLALQSPDGAGPYREEDVSQRSERGQLPSIKGDFMGFATTPGFRRRHRVLACSFNAMRASQTETEKAPGSIRALLNTAAGASPRRPLRLYRIMVLAEQAPNPQSRVTLGTERDALGQRKSKVRLSSRGVDQRTVKISLAHFARAVGALGRGRLQVLEPEPTLLAGGGHDMGTTRMADNPRHGVTDRDGRVHGVDNLYVAGSSLFPTVGYANPTLTLVALTLRLGDHLRGVVKPSRASPESGPPSGRAPR